MHLLHQHIMNIKNQATAKILLKTCLKCVLLSGLFRHYFLWHISFYHTVPTSGVFCASFTISSSYLSALYLSRLVNKPHQKWISISFCFTGFGHFLQLAYYMWSGSKDVLVEKGNSFELFHPILKPWLRLNKLQLSQSNLFR